MVTTSQIVDFYSKYPHLKDKIQLIWGTATCRILLIDLLAKNDRTHGQSREGFPPADASVVMELLHIHDTQFPKFNTDNHIDVPFTTYSVKSRPIEVVEKDTGMSWFQWIVLVLILSGAYIWFHKYLTMYSH
jgi:hypothetical protein